MFVKVFYINKAELMRSPKFLLLAILSVVAMQANAGNKIKYYFNHPPETSVSTGVDAINLNGRIDDTLIAYINRAKYTLDIAVYNFTSYSGAGDLSNVVNAINAAYTRGVKIRWIHNGTTATANTGLTTVNSAIPKLASPTGSAYNIMHDKFMVVDGHSPNPDESIVWTGSTNWSVAQFNDDYDNVVIVQDSALAHAYIGEFNQMWGDTGMTYNLSNSKFGPDKVDLGRHNFTIDGKQVELYFSPSDGTNNKIKTAILTANKDLYFGVYTMTDNGCANSIATVKMNGAYVAGIVDQYSNYSGNSAYATLTANLGSNFITYTGSDLYHNKYVVIDPSDACSDPMVLTGSHNWTSAANTTNDENTLIIHDATAANIYLQAFRGDFYALGGNLTKVYGCTSGVQNATEESTIVEIYPNPSSGDFTMTLDLASPQKVTAYITDISGRSFTVINDEWQPAGSMKKIVSVPVSGIYILKIVTQNGVYNHQIIRN